MQPEKTLVDSTGTQSIGISGALLGAAKWLPRRISKMNAGPADLGELIAQVPKRNRRCAVIGIAISGVQSMKNCLAEGFEPVGFEADSDIGGLWRYRDDPKFPSVYRSTHIDSDRDTNSFGDYPWDSKRPLLIHNTELIRYLRENIEKFGLMDKIKLNTRVSLVTPVGDHLGGELYPGWEVHYTYTDPATGEKTDSMEIFDCVLVCSGRHGGGGFIPQYPNQEKFKGPIMHSSQYKYPEKHNMVGKRVAVVGIGNSGADIVTELGMINGGGMRKGDGDIVNEKRSDTLLIARSGGWVARAPHLEVGAGMMAGEAIVGDFVNRQPWFLRDTVQGNSDEVDANQAQLNSHGMTPGLGHRRSQQHPIISGLAGQVWLGDQLDKEWIKMHRGFNMKKGFTEDGTGIWLNDKDGNPMDEATQVDAVVYATGYRQQAGFVDPKVVDMRFEREGNDVPLYKSCLPISQHKGLGFVNFIQGFTFPCGELQSRYLLKVFCGDCKLPSLEAQHEDMEDNRNAVNAQFIDRSQLRVLNGNFLQYYQDLAYEIGCYPTLWKLLTERPTAIWHAYFVFTMGSITQLTNRLVGNGRLENAERWIEEAYESRHFGEYQEAGAGYDHNFRKGMPKNKDGLGPLNRRDKWWLWDSMKAWNKFYWRQRRRAQQGYKSAEGLPMIGRPQEARMHLEQNVVFAREDAELRGITHSLELNAPVKDGFQDAGGEITHAFATVSKTAEGGGLMEADLTGLENEQIQDFEDASDCPAGIKSTN